jgi:hypothetical protein
MEAGTFMGEGAIVVERESAGTMRGPLAFATASEVSLIFAGILAYIWRWQHTFHDAAIFLYALILLSHALHRDSLRDLGLGFTEMRACAQWVLPLAIVFYLPLLGYGWAHHRLQAIFPNWQSLLSLLGYGIWCAFQQYLTQSYFNNRLMTIIHNHHVSSVLVGIMFAATHIPNPILTVATFVAGFIFAEVFARHRNIWPLALAQAVGGFLLGAVSPESLIHHLRVGPGYWFYGIR